MHEMALTQGVLGIMEDQARTQNFDRVKTVWLEIGDLSCVEPDALRFCFEAAQCGTIAEEAKLEIIRLPGQGWCMDCSVTIVLARRFDPCPKCGGHMIQITGGEEMRVKELEVV